MGSQACRFLAIVDEMFDVKTLLTLKKIDVKQVLTTQTFCILFAKVEDERLVGAALILHFEDERRPCQSHSLAGNNASKIFS